jgi:hypothetical protein
VAQRFSAAITGSFSAPALAAAVRLLRIKYFFSSLLKGTLKRGGFAASLKRCPDTKLDLFRHLLARRFQVWAFKLQI